MVGDLEEIRAAVRERALHQPEAARLPPARPVASSPAPPLETEPAGAPAPPRPDPAAVNELWRAEASAGPTGLLRRLFNRLQRPAREAQVAWNARQVQFDNELLAYLDGRLHATHLQYDAVLGIHARHMQEIDERHLILQEELVAHVHDLVKRIDLVLGIAERESLGLESSLRELRQKLAALESPPRPARE